MLQRMRIGTRILFVMAVLLAINIAASSLTLWHTYTIFDEGYTLIEGAAAGETDGLAPDLEAARVEMTRAFRNSLIITFVTSASVILLASVLGYYLTRSLIDPIVSLQKSAGFWAQGKLDHRTPTNGIDELAELGATLNLNINRQNNWYRILEKSIAERSAELEHRALHLETSVAIAQRITSILEPDLLLLQVTELIRQRYDLSYVGLFLPSRDGRSLILQASTRPEDTRLSLHLPIEEHTLIGWVALHRRPGLANNLLEQPEAVSGDRRQINSELALPLTLGKDLVGVLDLKSGRPDNFKRDDLPMFQSLADQAAIAIRNAASYQAEQAQRELAETLQQVGRALNSSLDLDDVLQLILAFAQQIIPYERGGVLFWNGEELAFGAIRQFGEMQAQPFPPIRLQAAGSNPYLAEIIDQKQPVLVNEIQKDERWVSAAGLPEHGAWLGLPLIRENAVSGILFLTRSETFSFTDREIAYANTMAAQAAIALENARLYAQIHRFNLQLEEEVEKRTLELQTAYNQLEQLDAAKSNFIHIASHELRTPMTVIKGYGQILLKDQKLLRDEQYRSMIHGILDGLDRLHDVVETMLDMARLDDQSFPISLESFSLFTLIREITEGLNDVLEERNLTISMTPAFRRLPAIEADRAGLRKVFYHLLVNAVKYTPDSGTISIDGQGWMAKPPNPNWPEQGVLVTVRDAGIGIDPGNLELIFNKFFQTGQVALHSTGKSKFKGGGPGLGLAIVRGIVEVHGGKVWAESKGVDETTPQGAAFHVVLPLRPPPPVQVTYNGGAVVGNGLR